MRINVVNKYKHKKTPHDFLCHRPHLLGNPFTHIKDKKTLACYIVNTREEAIEKHKEDFLEQVEINYAVKDEINKMLLHLKEHGILNLICFCYPKSCHCDTIKEYLLERLK